MRSFRIHLRNLSAAVLLAALLIPSWLPVSGGSLAFAFPSPSTSAGPAVPVEPAGEEPHARTAVYIIPGICGSDLYAASDLRASDLLSLAPELAAIADPSVEIQAGESLWVPQSLHPLSSLSMLSCDRYGRPYLQATTESTPVTYGPLSIYQYLVLRLEDRLGEEYDVRFFPYDWRMSSHSAATLLQESIDSSGYDEVILVAHSMGGLVASSFLAMSQANRDRTIRAFFIAVPFLGTPKTLYAAETGNIFNMPMLRSMTSPEAKQTASNFRSIPELLPDARAFDLPDAPYVSVDGKLLTDYASTRSFLLSLADSGVNMDCLSRAEAFRRSLFLNGSIHSAASVDSVFLCGKGRELVHTVRYDAQGLLTGVEFGGSGDATVPVWSASLGVSATGRASFGVTPDRVFYKDISHFGFMLDAQTAALIADRIAGKSAVAEDYGFTQNADQSDKDDEALLGRLAGVFEKGMFALYLRSIVDKLVLSAFD